MKKETTNITALKSKMWITDSLLSIMEEKEFKKITITEIIKKADLTRQTFYRNFNSKEDVLCEYVSKLYKECFNEIEKIPRKNMRKILETYFYYWYTNKNFLLLVKKSKLNYEFMNSYYQHMNNYFSKSFITLSNKSSKESEYIKHFLLGGLIQVKTRWSKQGFIETPDELAEIVLNSINPSLYDASYNLSTE